jgi:MFS family permease
MASRGINWTGIGFGFGLMALAAYQQLKLPPALPVLIEAYGFERILGGAFMSVYALSGLLLSLRLGELIQRHGAVVFLYAAFAMFTLAALAMMIWPENGWLFLAARAVEGVAFAILAIAGPSICTANAGPGGLAIASGIVAAWIPVGGLIASLVAAGIGLDEGGGDWRVLWAAGIAGAAALAFWTWRLHRQGGIDLGRPHTDTATTVQAAKPAAPTQWRDMTLAAFLFTLWSVQFFAYVTWLPAYLVEARGISVANAAALFMIPTALVTRRGVVLVAGTRPGRGGHCGIRHLCRRGRVDPDLPVRDAGHDLRRRPRDRETFRRADDRPESRCVVGAGRHRMAGAANRRLGDVGAHARRGDGSAGRRRVDPAPAVSPNGGIIREPGDSRRVRSPEFPRSTGRARSSGAIGRHGFPACAS